jgi:hypothetical protein
MSDFGPREEWTNVFMVKEKKNEKMPDFKSSTPVVIEGKNFDVSLYARNDKNGNTYYGCRITPEWKPEPKQEDTGEI